LIKVRKPKGFTERLYRLLPVWFNKQALNGFIDHIEKNPGALTAHMHEEERRDYERDLEQQWGSLTRGQIIHLIINNAAYDSRWREICANAMEKYGVSAHEIIECFKDRR